MVYRTAESETVACRSPVAEHCGASVAAVPRSLGAHPVRRAARTARMSAAASGVRARGATDAARRGATARSHTRWHHTEPGSSQQGSGDVVRVAQTCIARRWTVVVSELLLSRCASRALGCGVAGWRCGAGTSAMAGLARDSRWLARRRSRPESWRSRRAASAGGAEVRELAITGIIASTGGRERRTGRGGSPGPRRPVSPVTDGAFCSSR